MNKSKSGNEIVVTRSQEISPRNGETPKGPEQARIAQLEQNIRFLQEQHQLMLAGLHTEIQSLKNRNRGMKISQVYPVINQYHFLLAFRCYAKFNFSFIFFQNYSFNWCL